MGKEKEGMSNADVDSLLKELDERYSKDSNKKLVSVFADLTGKESQEVFNQLKENIEILGRLPNKKTLTAALSTVGELDHAIEPKTNTKDGQTTPRQALENEGNKAVPVKVNKGKKILKAIIAKAKSLALHVEHGANAMHDKWTEKFPSKKQKETVRSWNQKMHEERLKNSQSDRKR